jgi:hypothetical protein
LILDAEPFRWESDEVPKFIDTELL